MNLPEIKKVLGDPRGISKWFVTDFRKWHIERESPSRFKDRFFEVEGKLPELQGKGNGTTTKALCTYYHEVKRVGCFVESPTVPPSPQPTPPCPFETIMKHRNALARYVRARCFREEELVKMPQWVQNGVQVHDLVALRDVQGLLSLLNLELRDVLDTNVGGGWEDGLAPPDGGELVSMEAIEKELDFSPRADDDTGSGTGRWAYAVNLHEELETLNKDEPNPTPIQRVAKEVQSQALSLVKRHDIPGGPKAGLLPMLRALVKTMYHVDLILDRKWGKKKNGIRSKYVIKGLKLKIVAGSLLPRWHVKTRGGWIEASRIRYTDDAPAPMAIEEGPALLTSAPLVDWGGERTAAIHTMQF